MNAREHRVGLYYWPTIQGRGEFVRLLLEEAGADYVEVWRLPRAKGGMAAMMRFLDGEEAGALPFAPPFVKVGDVVVSQTANILAFLAPRLGLVPADEALRAEASQIQLTIADFVDEIHDTHHPIDGSLYYEDQKKEAKRRARAFVKERMPKYLGWLDDVLAGNRKSEGRWLVGRDRTYVDLSAFQVVEALRDRVVERPRIAAYLKSERRLPFNQEGIFRRYPELDAPAPRRRSGRARKAGR